MKVFHIFTALLVVAALVGGCQAVMSTKPSLGTVSGGIMGAIFAVFARMAQASAHRAIDEERREKAAKE